MPEQFNEIMYILRRSKTPFVRTYAALALIIRPVALFAWRSKSPPAKGKLPPSPKGLPILGSVLDLWNSNPWLTFAEWNKKYGPIVFKIVGHSAVILGTHKVAADLLDRRSAIYSDRPRNIVVHELMDGKLAFASGSSLFL
ncbi:hypothetical protein FPV67DRAFT_1454098 [Lyophyllum atratum]|nr:hypothetical protein FPV67DRAFT_1454098 [Lyophyllum atratum]